MIGFVIGLLAGVVSISFFWVAERGLNDKSTRSK